MASQNFSVDASPTKNFFIYMLTRDIDLKPAVVELIDNSIDGAKKICSESDYSKLWINITMDENSFTIEDNCSGISIETAQKYAFKFGRADDRPVEKDIFGTGIFGIGMKRTLFKLGRKFEIISATKTESYTLSVDVDEWIKDPEWNFKLSNVKTGQNNVKTGTKIIVTDLYDEVAAKFSSEYFINSLIDYIQKYRTVAAENGLQITVNRFSVNYGKEELIEGGDVKSYKNIVNDDQAIIRVLAGIASKGDPQKAGWYIYCNGRLVLYADKSNLTGWGDEVKQYHNDVAEFRGYVYFESTDLFALPWNTTKTGIDASNRLYVIAKEKMVEAMKQVFKAIQEAKKKYSVSDLEEVAFIKKTPKLELTKMTLDRINKNEDFEILEAEKPTPMTRISFIKPTEEVDVVKESMDETKNVRVGERLFEYYCEMEAL